MTPQSSPDTGIVRGASRGFTVLLLGGAVQPLVGLLLPGLGLVWLVVVAVAAFAWAALVATRHPDTTLVQPVCAAVGSYLLVLPVVFMAVGTVPVVQVLCTSALAVLVAGGVGVLRRGRRAPATGLQVGVAR